jgi:phospholipase/lecithinase/hemolysin
MMKNTLIGLLLTIISTFFLFLPSGYAASVDKIIIFGDSLSDNGNIYSLTKNAKKAIPLIPIIPKEPPYFQGRFSNGPVWIEQVAKLMNVPLENYAYGGAWAEPVLDSWLIVPFGLDMQVNFYLVSAALDFNKDKHLYVIWAGGNDYIQGRADAEYATSNTVASIKDQLEWLLYYGAKNVVIVNLPDVGATPEATSKGAAFAASVTRLSQLHNRKLATMVEQESKRYPHATLMLIDAKGYYDDVVSHPTKYLLKNTTEACYLGGFFLQRSLANNLEVEAAKKVKIDILNNPALRTAYLTSMSVANGDTHCMNPDEYVFWDAIHPTRVVHQILATLSFNQLYEYGLKGQANP